MKLTNDIRSMILIAFVVFGVFANTLGGDFVYDDSRQILRNPLIQSSSNYAAALTSDVWAFKGDGTLAGSNYYRPVFTAWSILLWRLFGANPFGWHLFSVLLHVAAALLAFKLLRVWELPPLLALTGALVFAVHPAHTESVAWIAGAPDLLCAAGLLGALLLTESFAASGSKMKLAAAVVMFAVALGSKEVALACVPVFALVFFRRGETLGRSLVRAVPFAVAAVIFFVVRWRVIGAISLPVEDPPSLTSALLSLPSVVFFYFKQVVLPLTLSVNYALRPVETPTIGGFLAPLLIVSAIATVLFLLARRSRNTAPAVAIFLLALLPALNLTAFPSDQIVHDRYLYLPLFGLVALALIAVNTVADGKFALASSVVASILVVPLVIQTASYNRVWNNEMALWTNAARVDPNSAATLVNYGSVLSATGRTAESVEVFSRAIAISQPPLAFNGRGRNLMALGRFDEAEADFRAVIALPNEKSNAYTLYQSYEALALLLSQRGRFDEAVVVLKDARTRLPIYAAALTEKLAVVLYQKNEKPAALDELERVREQARREMLPESKNVFLRLGMLYAENGRRDDARRALGEFLTLTESAAGADSSGDRKQAATILRSLGTN